MPVFSKRRQGSVLVGVVLLVYIGYTWMLNQGTHGKTDATAAIAPG